MIKRLCVCSTLCLLLSSCYIYRAYRSRNFYLKDLPKFTAQKVLKSTAPFYFPVDTVNNNNKWLRDYLDASLQNRNTYAFVVIRNDTIIYDRYFDNLNSQNIFPSFSVAKSFVSTLVQIAYQENYIKSFQDPITKYLPYLLKRDKHFASITIQHLLDMRSGIYSNENYSSPFADVIKMGFRNNIQRQLKQLKIAKPPGEFEYISVNAQLLGMIVQQATGKKLYNYLQEKIWQPLGMEADATWLIDSKKNDNVRAFCCLNAVAHDFAKLGRLYLNKGKWNGKQILNEKWVESITSPDSMYKYDGYKNQWWGVAGNRYFNDSLEAKHYQLSMGKTVSYYGSSTPETGEIKIAINHYGSDFFAHGILEQYIYVNPKANTIIVRLGHYGRDNNSDEDPFIISIGKQLER